MALASTSWRGRPLQRSRFGIKALDIRHRPTASELGFDRLVVAVPGEVHFIRPDSDPFEDPPETTTTLMKSYRSLLERRGASTRSWGLPGRGPDYFRTNLFHHPGTISAKTGFITKGTQRGLGVKLTMTLNPTRTLIHSLEMVRHTPDALAALMDLPVDQFFERALSVERVPTLDASDNIIGNLTEVVDRLGVDWAGAFIRIFEEKLKLWALEAVAPVSEGFAHGYAGEQLYASDALHRVALNWDRLYPAEAEVYFERRHGDALDLMDRLTTAIMASHTNCEWRRYPISEIGGRRSGSTFIGVKPTKRTKIVIYAKTSDRIRIETRFSFKVKDNLRGTPISADSPLSDILIALRTVAVTRLDWDSLCEMASDVPEPRIEDCADLVTRISRCCTKVHVRPEPVLEALIGAGSFAATDRHGAFTPELVSKLHRAGLISDANIIRRSRPGEERRHHLVEPYATVARAMRQGFAQMVRGVRRR
ncbi:hypothetical protein FSZ31_11285 [Sphingorhabdus soli]|uniref:Uncharacterized protein n=1 Tax=Flavisphingopyxis soli TaxID=2601267 RepID=A0A5C6U815_9SPHN|nr:hypothetical protein [Sphingorhabdus soli]TXC68261.1 hypothetical protein FSZ31_11285 [Sphingorhabdus soli]